MIAVAALPVHAQIVGDTLRLGANDVVERVMASPALGRARLAVTRAEAERSRVAFLTAPLDLEYTRRSDAPFHDVGEGGWGISASQEFEIGGEYFLRRDAADAGLAQAELEARAAELDLRATALRQYVALVAADARRRLLDTLAAFARRLDTLAARLLAAQEISELDRNAIGIERGRAEIEFLGAESRLIDARSELGRLLALPSSTIVMPSGAADEIMAAPAATLDSVAAVERAFLAGDDTILQRRPDWQALERAAKRLRSERSLAARRWIPTVRLGVGLDQETSLLSGDEITGGSAEIRNGFGELRSRDQLLVFSVGIAIPLPVGGLYDFGRGDMAVADAELAVIASEQRLLADRIRADVARAAGRLRSAARVLSISTQRIGPLVARNLELLERGYAGGELSATELVTQQEQFLRAGEASIDARREYDESVIDFERAVAR